MRRLSLSNSAHGSWWIQTWSRAACSIAVAHPGCLFAAPVFRPVRLSSRSPSTSASRNRSSCQWATSGLPAPIERGGHGIGVLHVTGGNYSKGHREDSVAGFVDGNAVAIDDLAG